jgi:outer membrane receptor for ferric coprogen and ferric-rhodotorulic acid
MTVVGTRSRARIALALVCASLFPGAMLSAERAYTLHIASGPLDSALQEFARQTGIQILFFSYLTEGQRVRALDGTYTVDVAMNALLADSALTFRWVNGKTIEIRRLGRRTDRAN